MRRSKGYANELEILTRDDRGVNLSIKLKAAATKKMRLRVIAYSQSEYWYANRNKGYIMTYKDYSIARWHRSIINMRRRRYRKRYRRKRRGHRILPYIKNNKVYFGGKLQRGEGILHGLLANVIPLIGRVI